MAVRAIVRQVIHLESLDDTSVRAAEFGVLQPRCVLDSCHPSGRGPRGLFFLGIDEACLLTWTLTTFNGSSGTGWGMWYDDVVHEEDHIEIEGLAGSRTGGSQVAAFDATVSRDGSLR